MRSIEPALTKVLIPAPVVAIEGEKVRAELLSEALRHLRLDIERFGGRYCCSIGYRGLEGGSLAQPRAGAALTTPQELYCSRDRFS